MMTIALAFVYFIVVLSVLSGAAVIERSSRLAGVLHRREAEAPLARWGNQRQHAPASYALARALASSARLVRGKTVVAQASAPMRRSSRVLCLFATASALSMIPFAGTWAGNEAGQPLVAVDLEYGLGVIVFLILLSGLAHAATGLAETNAGGHAGEVFAGESQQLLTVPIRPLAAGGDHNLLGQQLNGQRVDVVGLGVADQMLAPAQLDLVPPVGAHIHLERRLAGPLEDHAGPPGHALVVASSQLADEHG